MGQVLRALAGPSQSCDAELLKAAFDVSPEGMALAEGGRVLYTTPPSRSYWVTRIAQKFRTRRWLIFGRTARVVFEPV